MTINTLRIQREIVALEAFTVNDVTALLKGIFPSLKESFVDFSRMFNPSEAAVALLPSHNDFKKEVSKHAYMDIIPLAAYVPEGLSKDTKFIEYGDYLLAAAKHASEVLGRVLDPYTLYLSQLVSNNDLRLSVNSFETQYKVLEKERDILTGDLGGCFDRGSTRVNATIGQVVARNSDWDDVFNQCEQMTRLITSVDRKKLNKKLAEAVEFLTMVERKIASAEMEGVSPSVVKNLSDGAFQVASELEFFSVIYYRVEVFVNCVNRTITHFQEVMKQ